MDTSGPSTASTAPLSVRTIATAAAAHARPTADSRRAGFAVTGRSRSTYIRWCLLVPLSRDTRPGSSGIRPGRARDEPGRRPGTGRSRRGDGPQQEADQLVGVGPGVAGQVGPAGVGGDARVH